MKIVIDARMINASGIGRYLLNLLDELQELDRENDYYILHLKPDYDTLVYHNKNFHKVLADFRWYTVAEQIRLPRILKQINANLVHFPHFNVPIIYSGKFVVTIHDLIHQHYPTRKATTRDPVTYRIKRFSYNLAFKRAINKSQKILTPSNFVKNQLEEEWRVDPNKIVVTPEGVDKNFTIGNNLSTESTHEVLKKFDIKQPFLFYVGNAHPHKNVEGLIKAFMILRKKYPYLQLVISGQDSPFWKKIKGKYGIQDIVYTGFITDEELVALYKSTEVFVMPSFEEGFGIPILEAMAMGCPVVSSNTGSLPEVGGDAAEYFNPNNIEEMSAKIIEVLNSEELQKELISKGKERIKQFSWKKMAQKTLEIYNTV